MGLVVCTHNKREVKLEVMRLIPDFIKGSIIAKENRSRQKTLTRFFYRALIKNTVRKESAQIPKLCLALGYMTFKF